MNLQEKITEEKKNMVLLNEVMQDKLIRNINKMQI